MEMTPVKSSNIKAIGHDPAAKKLRVEFTNGGLYEYQDVAPHHYSTMLSHESPGKYFAQHVRGSHGVEKLTPGGS
jgi:lysyl-tRNA synthetase class 2